MPFAPCTVILSACTSGVRRLHLIAEAYFFSTSAMKLRASRMTSSVIPMCPLSV